MTRSQPRKVVLLALVAVGACGYLGYSLIGIGGRFASKVAESTAAPAETSRSLHVGVQLVGDPFSPPLFIQKQAEAKQAAAATINAGGNAPSPVPFGPDPGSIPLPLPGAINLQATAASLGPAQPAEIAGNDRKTNEERRLSVRLTAVVTVERAIAFFSVSGKDSRAYREGDALGPGWRVLRITESGVEIGGPKVRRSVAVGQEVDL